MLPQSNNNKMEANVVLCAALEPEKPKRFYLKKWFIAIVAAISSAYCALGTLAVAVLIGIFHESSLHGAENDHTGSKIHTPVFVVLVVIGIFASVCELLGSIGAYKERIKWVYLYLVYSIGRFVVYMIARCAVAVFTRDLKPEAYFGMAIDALFTVFFLAVTYYYLADLKAIRNAQNGNCTFKSKEEEANWSGKSFV